MSRDVLQPRQSGLMNRQLELASSYHRTSMTIHTVWIWHPWFQRVHKGWTNTTWQGACHIPVQGCGRRSHTNRYPTSPEMPLFLFVAISPQREPPGHQMSRSLIGVETEPKLPVWLAEPLNHLSTVWHLVDVSPTVLLEDLKPNCTAPTWSSFQVYLIPDRHPSTVISYGPFFPSHQRTLMSLSGQFSTVSRRFYKTRPIVHHHWVWPLTKQSEEEHQGTCKLILRMCGFHIAHNFLGTIG